MVLIAGLIIGLVTGTVQYMLLARFARGITKDGISKDAMLCGIVQFILPFIVLTGCAFLLRRDLLPAGIGIVVALFAGAGVTAIRSRKRRAAPKQDDEEGEA